MAPFITPWRNRMGFMDSRCTNLLLIGLGPHAKRIYYPIFIKDGQKHNFKIVHGVDLITKKGDIEKYFYEKNHPPLDMLYLSLEERSYSELPPSVVKKLNAIVKQKNITGVIISTEPRAHFPYAKWALRNGLSILMDKPVSVIENVSTSLSAAEALKNDYLTLEKMYEKAKTKNPDLTFSLMAQRRYHPAFQKVKHLIGEVFRETNCPVTSIQSFHSDGQWRMPTEIVDQDYHPYNQGYGKCCHSGYHSIDIVSWLLEDAMSADKQINNVDIFANFVRPAVSLP